MNKKHIKKIKPNKNIKPGSGDPGCAPFPKDL